MARYVLPDFTGRRYDLPPDLGYFTPPELDYDPTQYGELGPSIEPDPYSAELPPMLEPGALTRDYSGAVPGMGRTPAGGESLGDPMTAAKIIGLPFAGDPLAGAGTFITSAVGEPASGLVSGALRGADFEAEAQAAGVTPDDNLLDVAGKTGRRMYDTQSIPFVTGAMAALPQVALPASIGKGAPGVRGLAPNELDIAGEAIRKAATEANEALPDSLKLAGGSRASQMGQAVNPFGDNPLSEMGKGADGVVSPMAAGRAASLNAKAIAEYGSQIDEGWTPIVRQVHDATALKAAQRELKDMVENRLSEPGIRDKIAELKQQIAYANTGADPFTKAEYRLQSPDGKHYSQPISKSAFDALTEYRTSKQSLPVDAPPPARPPEPPAGGVRQLPTEEQVEANVRAALERRFPPDPPPPDMPVSREGPPPSAADAGSGSGKERGFPRTVRESPTTSDVVSDVLEDNPRLYQPITIRGTFEQAAAEVDADPYQATLKFLDTSTPWDANKSSIGQVLVRRADAAGEYDLALRYVDHLGEQATRAGQANAVIAGFDQLSPEGVLRYAQRVVKRVQELDPKTKVKLTGEKAGEFTRRAEAIGKLPEGRERLLQQHELMRDISNLVPPTFWERLGLYQTWSMLSGPKTIARNLAGNAVHNAALRSLDSSLQDAFDRALKLRTGQRTTASTMQGYRAGTAGLARGAAESVEEVGRGVNLAGPSQYELPQPRFANDTLSIGGVRPFEFFEKYLGYVLRVPDRIFTQGSLDKNLVDMATVKAINEGLEGAERGKRVLALVASPPDDLLKAAKAQAAADVFQDDNYLSGLFSLIKSAGNTAGRGKVVGHVGKLPVHEFGMGDIVLKFAKTPGSLLYQGLKYSPLSWGSALKNTAEVLATGNPAKQKAAVASLSAAVIGTGLTTFGATMADNGIMSVEGRNDKRLNELLQTNGVPVKYAFNWSAFERWLGGGFKPQSYQKGDSVFSYDWMMPFSVPVAMGARVAETRQKELRKASQSIEPQDKGLLDQIADNAIVDFGTLPLRVLAAGADTIAVQPMLRGMKTLFGYGSPAQGLVEVLLSAPATLVPSLAAAVERMTDPYVRETYDPDDIKNAMNYVLSRVPGMAASLPVKTDVFGEPVKKNTDAWNVLLNPANAGQYFPRPEAEMLVELRKASELATEAIPTAAPKEFTVRTADGKPVKVTLSAEEWSKYQQTYGAMVKRAYSNLATDEAFRASPPEQQIKTLNTISTALKLQAAEELRQRAVEADGGVTSRFGLLDPLKGREGAGITQENAERWARERPLLEKYDNAAKDIDAQNKAFAQAQAQWQALSGAERDRFERQNATWKLRDKTIDKYRDQLQKQPELREALYYWRNEGPPPKDPNRPAAQQPTLSPQLQKMVDDARKLADQYLGGAR